MRTRRRQAESAQSGVKTQQDAGKSQPPDETGRSRAYQEGLYPWNIYRVPRTLRVKGKNVPHPGRTSAIFCVHGIGEQAWTETAAQLRSGFEEALAAIACWQRKNPDINHVDPTDHKNIPPPFVFEGYWANYENLEETFKEDWQRFNERERRFFGHLWKLRTLSVMRTFVWFLKQQFRLLSPRVLKEVGLLSYLLYFPLQIVSLTTLIFALARRPKLITGFLGDVRLYLDPKGLVEEAIVQRIDYRVGEAFLRMIGLDWDFRKLPQKQLIEASGKRISFERVVWVAHSLGTVISYNVLSDLFHRAGELGRSGDAAQKKGVKHFKGALRRFVTLGSPLDKAAFLFKKSLKPWPQGSRRALLDGGETLEENQLPEKREWWINFYHVLDPVSGALSSPVLCAQEPPANFHIGSGCIPGLAHMAYWEDARTLRFILGRTYGRDYLRDKEYRPWSPQVLSALSILGYTVWAGILTGLAYEIVRWAPDIIKLAVKNLKGLIGM